MTHISTKSSVVTLIDVFTVSPRTSDGSLTG